MSLLLDSFWRAVLYCVHPRVVLLSLLPLFLLLLITGAASYFLWSDAVHFVHMWLAREEFFSMFVSVLTHYGLESFRMVVAPLIVMTAVTPLLIFGITLLVAWFMIPALSKMVLVRRLSSLSKAEEGGASTLYGVMWTLVSVLMAGILLVLSIPIWLIPPLAMVFPPLIWGWLAYRVMSYEVLSRYATHQEARDIMKAHRMPLLLIGLLSGYLGALPSLIWASAALTPVFAVVVLPLVLWLYVLAFIFSALWFTHYCLVALAQHRAAAAL